MLSKTDIDLAESASLTRDVERWAQIVAELAGEPDFMKRAELCLELGMLRNKHHGPPGNLVELQTLTMLRRMEMEQAQCEAGNEKGLR